MTLQSLLGGELYPHIMDCTFHHDGMPKLLPQVASKEMSQRPLPLLDPHADVNPEGILT